MNLPSGAIEIKGSIRLVGLIGRKIEYTLSPLMHNTLFHSMQLDYVYLPLPVEPEHLDKAVNALRVFNFAGVNITIPYKEKVLPMLDDVSDEAKRIGAINTINVEENGILKGYNTDVHGFLDSLKEEMDFTPEGVKVVIIGAGGAGRAIAFGCALNNAQRICLIDVDIPHLRSLAKDLNTLENAPDIAILSADDSNISHELASADLVVNATPIGIKPGEGAPISLESVNSGAVVFDAIYALKETGTIRAAREAGVNKAINGLGMLVHQGARAFELWTGYKPDVSLMRRVVESHVYAQ